MSKRQGVSCFAGCSRRYGRLFEQSQLQHRLIECCLLQVLQVCVHCNSDTERGLIVARYVRLTILAVIVGGSLNFVMETHE